jgi:3-dehydroquinate synthase
MMTNSLKIGSKNGSYTVFFKMTDIEELNKLIRDDDFVIIDSNIAKLYQNKIKQILTRDRIYILEALEENKTFAALEPVYEFLMAHRIRKKSRIIAIGGGITQDISCFIASTIYRGIDWVFVPTTLLAQCDSCIGSKSSINLKSSKNSIGNFYPPSEIHIYFSFLNTLPEQEIKSGIGEIFKVSVIDNLTEFFNLTRKYKQLFFDKKELIEYIKYALLVKKKYIEIDEYDTGLRNIFNYGHSFGHALESASGFTIPHGVAVSMGIDIANYISYGLGMIEKDQLILMHQGLFKNFEMHIPKIGSVTAVLSALESDKKNTSNNFVFILLNKSNLIKIELENNELFKKNIKLALDFIKDGYAT